MGAELALLTQIKNSQSRIGEVKEFLSQDNFLTIYNQTWMRNGNYTTSSDPMANTIDIGSLRLPTTVTNTNASINCSIKVGSLITASTSVGTILQSNTNGESWTVSASGKPLLKKIVYGNGIYVGITSDLSSTTAIYTSTDGLTWTARTGNNATLHETIAFGNGFFLIGTNSGTTSCLSASTDGITWVTKAVAAGTYCRVINFIKELGVFVINAMSNIHVFSNFSQGTADAGSTGIQALGNSGNYFDTFVWFNNKCYFLTATSSSGLRAYESTDGLIFKLKKLDGFSTLWSIKDAKVIDGLLCILNANTSSPYLYTTNMIDFYINDTYPEAVVNAMGLELADNGNVVMLGNNGGTTSKVTIGTRITGFGLPISNDNSYVRVL